MFPYADPMFSKRFKWIIKCGEIASGLLHHLDYIKANTSRYFFESTAMRVPFKYEWGWGMTVKDLAFHSCYFLGTYPNYWNVENKRIVYAHNLWTLVAYPMPNSPFIHEAILSDAERKALNDVEILFGKTNLEYYLFPERLPTDLSESARDYIAGINEQIDKYLHDELWFHDVEELKDYLMEKLALDARKKRFKDCIAVKYPTPPKLPPPTPPPPAKPYEIPMKELIPPVPSKSIRVPGEKYIELDFSFGEKIADPNNIMQVSFWITEVPAGAGPGYTPTPK